MSRAFSSDRRPRNGATGAVPGRNGYVLAVGVTAMPLAATAALSFEADGQPGLVLLVLPILLSAYAGGLGPGLHGRANDRAAGGRMNDAG